MDDWTQLEELRRSGAREPERVVRIATRALGGAAFLQNPRAAGPSGDARWWAAAEQLFVAALDSGRHALAQGVLAKFERRFPPQRSAHSRRLGAMLLEARGDVAGAGAAYAALVAADPADLPSMKRQIALLRAAGDVPGAIAQLNVLLRVFAADCEAWCELAELYVVAQRPRLAAFCYEELLLAQPHSHVLWTRCAEAHYTCGEFVLARKAYSRAVELSAACADARTLLGLCMACAAVQGSRQMAPRTPRDAALNRDLHAFAAKKLAPMLPIVVPMLTRQRALFV